MNRLLSILVPLGLVTLMAFVLLTGNGRRQLFSGRSDTGDAFSTRSTGGRTSGIVGPGSRHLENNAANTVTAVVLDYRGFDTLGEVTVLFVSIAGAGLILAGRKRRKKTAQRRGGSLILRTAAPWILMFLLVVGFMIILHGHLTPGGGFPGGAMLAAGLVLLMSSSGHDPDARRLHLLEGLAGLAFVLTGALGLLLRDSFLAHFWNAGALGAFLSAPVSMLLYLIIGLKVAAELVSAVRTLAHVEDSTNEEVP